MQADHKSVNKKGIQFLGIGAQKAGTSWLSKRLSELPNISTPPIKEIHYFDRSKKYPSPNVHSRDNLFYKLLSLGWYRGVKRNFLNPILNGNTSDIGWKLKFFLFNPTDEWYISLFNDLPGICGEIAPDYSILELKDVKRIASLFPDVKIILLLRDPIERAWSHFRYVHKTSDLNNIKKIKRFIDSREQEDRSDYLKIIEKYSAVFSQEQMYISFYDRVSIEPIILLKEIVAFIGGDITNVEKYCQINQKANVSKVGEMPPKIQSYLRVKYKHEIEKLSEQYGHYPKLWMKKHYEAS